MHVVMHITQLQYPWLYFYDVTVFTQP